MIQKNVFSMMLEITTIKNSAHSVKLTILKIDSIFSIQAHMEELRRKAYRRRLFNEQAAKLVARTPSLRDEVAWRVDHLNAKWELVEQIMAPAQPTSDQQDVSAGKKLF